MERIKNYQFVLVGIWRNYNMRKPYKIRKLFNVMHLDINSRANILLHIGNYLNYLESLKQRQNFNELTASIRQEPKYFTNIPDYIYAMIAGIVEVYCNENSLSIPYWVSKKKYTLGTPWYDTEYSYTEGLLKQQISDSAPEFLKHNLYIARRDITVY